MSSTHVQAGPIPADCPPSLGPASVKNAEHLLGEVTGLPSAPPIAFKLLTMMKRENQRNDDLVEVVKYDANLTTALLKVCNSSIYHKSVPIASVEDAILLLGYNRLTEMVFTISCSRMYTNSKHQAVFNPYELWRENVYCSIAAKVLSSLGSRYQTDSNVSFTTGILHSMGKFALNHCHIPQVREVASVMQSEHLSSHAAEFKVLGTDSAVIGALLLKGWDIPLEIVEATHYQYYPEFSPSPLASLCHIASHCAQAIIKDKGMEHFNQNISQKALEVVGIELNTVEKVLEKIKHQANEVQSFMMIA